MANNSFGTLGGAYSILGQATTAEYNRRKREEDKARRRARRDARKDQLLAYFAQPLLKGAGEALAGGVSDLFGRAVLGPNAANYFDTEEGMIVKSKALAADAQERRLGKRLSALDGQKGRSRQENNRDLFGIAMSKRNKLEILLQVKKVSQGYCRLLYKKEQGTRYTL